MADTYKEYQITKVLIMSSKIIASVGTYINIHDWLNTSYVFWRNITFEGSLMKLVLA